MESLSHYHILLLVIVLTLLLFSTQLFLCYCIRTMVNHFKKKKKIWPESFFESLFLPLIYLIWSLFVLFSLNLFLDRQFPNLTIPYFSESVEVLVTLSFGWFLLRWKNKLAQHYDFKAKNEQKGWNHGKITSLSKLGNLFVFLVVLFFIFEITGVPMTTLVAFGGLGGLAFAFASQEVISNLFGGFMIFVLRPFSQSETIFLPEKNIKGTIQNMGWYGTLLHSEDQMPIFLPNSLFSKAVIATPSRQIHTLFNETFQFSPEDMNEIEGFLKNINLEILNFDYIDFKQKPKISLQKISSKHCEINIQFLLKKDAENDWIANKNHFLMWLQNYCTKKNIKIISRDFLDQSIYLLEL